MARRGSPALYELLGRGRENKNSPVIPVQIPNRAPARPGRSGISIGPGSVKSTETAAPRTASTSEGRKPSGIDPAAQAKAFQIFGIAAVVIVLLVMVYSAGVSRGRSGTDSTDATAGSESEVAVGTDSGSGEASAAPRNTIATGEGAGGSTRTPPSPAARSENATASASPRTTEPQGDGALPPAQPGVDPRQAGLHYCVIASVLESNADKLVSFCRERGLDAWVVRDHNGRLREITVLPGIPASDLKGPKAKALEERIRRVGQQWKAAGRNNSDFEDRYFKLFKG
ncbi:MAG: hypothetical protein RLZZ238_777 [Planctomycetota bacterium]